MAAGLFSIFITQSYAGIIRYTGVQDGLRIVYSVSLGVALTLLLNGVNLWLVGRVLLPLSVLIISYFSSVIFLFAYRIIVKYIFRYYTKAVRKDIKNALIFGAGESGLVTNQIIEHDHHSQIRVSAFIEDNLRKVGKEINGLKIYDASKDLKFLIKKLNIHELIISVQDLSLERKNELVDICLQYDIKVRTTPPMSKWIKGELRLNQIKDINIEDLLGRESIRLDNIKVSSELRNKCILITGAAGSIGSELARQVLLYKPANVVLVDQSETSLHDFENELNHNGSVIKMHPFYIKPIVADICNYNRMNLIFKEYKPEIVFHAAAYKHVPMMET
ncbi:MAG: polysaccharide biosynthesis protein, partial [Bacteroidetes bacterium]|nr:polysaccharide biosynthesis protein [Bacteroidota bacterium]